jgi:hypothetical protein
MIQTPGSTESTSNQSDASQRHAAEKQSRAVGLGRYVFIATLILVAALLGYGGHLLLTRAETNLAESQFITINERALSSAVGIAGRKLLGGDAVATFVGYALPDAEPWPFVFVPGYNDIVANIVPTSLSKGLNFAPIVLPEQAEAWEEFAYDYYDNFFPNGTSPAPAISSFGKGMWAKDSSVNSSDHRFHDISGETPWGSPNKILVPKMHHSIYNSPLLQFQVHYPPIHGRTIDGVIECSKIRAKSDDPRSINCGTISEFAISNCQCGPGGLVVIPIYPANNFTTVRRRDDVWWIDRRSWRWSDAAY